MSKSTRQSQTLLCIIGGCLFEIHRKRLFSVVVMHELTWDTYAKVVTFLKEWEETGDKKKNLKWILERVEQWKESIKEDDDKSLLTTLAATAEHCLADLQEVNTYPVRVKMLIELAEPLRKIHSFSDPEGRNFPAYEKASELIDKIHKLIEWEGSE